MIKNQLRMADEPHHGKSCSEAPMKHNIQNF